MGSDTQPKEEMHPAARVIAFYLPQFHPIPENDQWWGHGFTEWTNVAKAKPLFWRHRQPRIPADLGFYDLRVPESRQKQAEMARDAGVEAFCYWHYWWGHGRRILERPFEEVRDSGEPDFPFCLAWANQSWTGVWHGNPKTVLMKQEYPSRDDEKAHFEWALKAFEDARYLRVDGKPMFVVFAPHDLPSTASFIDHWRELAQQAGLPGLYFVAISNRYEAGVDPYHSQMLEPFDAITPLVPQDYLETRARQTKGTDRKRQWKELNFGRHLNALKPSLLRRPTRINYKDVVEHALEDLPPGPRFLPSVLPGWDNTPRSGYRGVVYDNETPELFRQYMQKAVSRVAPLPNQHRIVFLKAWNEWAEGNYVEPDLVNGHAYLNVLKSVLLGRS